MVHLLICNNNIKSFITFSDYVLLCDNTFFYLLIAVPKVVTAVFVDVNVFFFLIFNVDYIKLAKSKLIDYIL